MKKKVIFDGIINFDGVAKTFVGDWNNVDKQTQGEILVEDEEAPTCIHEIIYDDGSEDAEDGEFNWDEYERNL